MNRPRLERPIIFVGVPRSGTTILFEAFIQHKIIGWLSNYSEMYPKLHGLNLLRPLLSNDLFNLSGRKKQQANVLIGNRYIPQPNEAYHFWDHYSKYQFSREYLLNIVSSTNDKQNIRYALDQIMKWQLKERFATKLTGPARIKYLQSIFSDAIFVHVIRDGRAVVNSLLKVSFWRDGGGYDRPWWEGGLSEGYLDIWHNSNRNPAVLAAIQWRTIIELARKEAMPLGTGQYLEVHYEIFMDDPHQTLHDLFEKCGLEDSPQAHTYIDQGPALKNMNMKFQRDMSLNDIQEMTSAMQPLLGELGYV